ncbi:MAG: cytochrome c peroxidase [Pirellulaceae bacterium]
MLSSRVDLLSSSVRFSPALLLLVGHLLSSAAPSHTLRAEDPALSASLRRPVALQLSADESRLLVANARSGSLSVLDVAARKVVGEFKIGEQLSDIKRLPGSNQFAVTDESGHELLIAELRGDQITVLQRIAVARYPVSITVADEGRRIWVASLWSQRLSAVARPSSGEGAAELVAQIDLPFAPRCQVLVENGKRLIAADAFHNRLAVIDAERAALMHVRSFPSHNMRGLGLNADGTKLLVAHQMLNELAHTTNNDVHWGLLMSNDLRWLPLASVLSPDVDLYRGAHMHPLGSAGNATGDPSGLCVTSQGLVIVTLGGVGEVAIGTENDFNLHRLTAGRRPTAVIATQAGDRAFVANTLGDSISVIDLGKRDVEPEISLGAVRDLTLAERGEFLFYDATLSHDGWMSCHSCHTDGHANSLLNDNFSDDSFGAPKRVLSLLGVRETTPLAWNGTVAALADQVRNSIVNTMQGDEAPSDRQVQAMVAFIHTLEPPPPLDATRQNRDSAQVARGAALFEALQCDRCHAPPTYTTPGTYDVGIHDKQGNTKFNPPSLRGVSQRGPYFHDNRAVTLEDVFRQEGHQLDRGLEDRELAELLAFLRSL